VLLSREDLSFDDTCSHLRSHILLDKDTDSSVASVYLAQSKDVVCSFCNKKGHNAKTCFRNMSPSDLEELKKNWRCRKCHNSGHFTNSCPISKSQDSESVSMMISSLSKFPKSDAWIIDSGSTNHMCNDAGLAPLKSKSPTKSFVSLANGAHLACWGSGSVNFVLSVDGRAPIPVELSNVLYIPGLSRNILSVFACISQGIYVHYVNHSQNCFLRKSGAIVGVAKPQLVVGAITLFRVYRVLSL